MSEINFDSLRKMYDQKTHYPVSEEVKRRNEFSDREVGLTHPDLSSFLRLNDQGDIEIFAAPGVGIVISSKSKSISFFGDSVRFFCQEDGLRWNNYKFNYAASSYIEPTLVKINRKSIHSAQNGISHYMDMISVLEEEEQQKTITIDKSYGYGNAQVLPEQNLTSNVDYSNLSVEQIGLLEAYSTDYSPEHINLIVKFIEQGLDFNQAHERALTETNE